MSLVLSTLNHLASQFAEICVCFGFLLLCRRESASKRQEPPLSVFVWLLPQMPPFLILQFKLSRVSLANCKLFEHILHSLECPISTRLTHRASWSGLVDANLFSNSRRQSLDLENTERRCHPVLLLEKLAKQPYPGMAEWCEKTGLELSRKTVRRQMHRVRTVLKPTRTLRQR